MPGVIGNIVIGMGVNTRSFNRGIYDAQAQLQHFSAAVQGQFNRMVGIAASAAAGAGVAGMFVNAAKAASALNEQVSATGVMFGPSAKVVQDDADAMAKKFGTVKTQYLEAANSLAPMIDNLGQTGDEAAKTTISILHLADDLQSIRNVPFKEALEAIQSGLAGQERPLRRFGAFLTEDAVKMEAMRLGLVKANTELNESQKIQARLSLITRDLNYAVGDHARTLDGIENQARLAWGSYENAMADLGKTIEPITAKLLLVAGNIVDKIAAGIRNNQDAIVGWATSIADEIKGVDITAGDIRDTFNVVAEGFKIGTVLVTGFGTALLSIVKIAGEVAQSFTYLGEDLIAIATLGFWKPNLGTKELGKFNEMIGNVRDSLYHVGKNVEPSIFTDALAPPKGWNEDGTPGDWLKGATTATEQLASSAADAGKEVARAMSQIQGASSKLTSGMDEELSNWGLTKFQKQVRDLTDEFDRLEKERQKALGAGNFALGDAISEQQKKIAGAAFGANELALADDAKAMIEATKTPMEKWQEETQKIGELLASNKITDITAARAQLKTNSDYENAMGPSDKRGAALEYGSQEARSAILSANSDISRQVNDPMRQVANYTRDSLQEERGIREALRSLAQSINQSANIPATVRF